MVPIPDYICIDEIQNGPLPLLEKIEFIKNSETLWTKVLKKLITLLKISLKILKNDESRYGDVTNLSVFSILYAMMV